MLAFVRSIACERRDHARAAGPMLTILLLAAIAGFAPLRMAAARSASTLGERPPIGMARHISEEQWAILGCVMLLSEDQAARWAKEREIIVDAFDDAHADLLIQIDQAWTRTTSEGAELGVPYGPYSFERFSVLTERFSRALLQHYRRQVGGFVLSLDDSQQVYLARAQDLVERRLILEQTEASITCMAAHVDLEWDAANIWFHDGVPSVAGVRFLDVYFSDYSDAIMDDLRTMARTSHALSRVQVRVFGELVAAGANEPTNEDGFDEIREASRLFGVAQARVARANARFAARLPRDLTLPNQSAPIQDQFADSVLRFTVGGLPVLTPLTDATQPVIDDLQRGDVEQRKFATTLAQAVLDARRTVDALTESMIDAEIEYQSSVGVLRFQGDPEYAQRARHEAALLRMGVQRISAATAAMQFALASDAMRAHPGARDRIATGLTAFEAVSQRLATRLAEYERAGWK